MRCPRCSFLSRGREGRKKEPLSLLLTRHLCKLRVVLFHVRLHPLQHLPLLILGQIHDHEAILVGCKCDAEALRVVEDARAHVAVRVQVRLHVCVQRYCRQNIPLVYEHVIRCVEACVVVRGCVRSDLDA